MKQQTIISFHFPHKTGSMFGFEVLRKMAMALDAPLYSQNNNPHNHQSLFDAVISGTPKLVLRGPVRDFSQTDEDSSIPTDLANETPLRLLHCSDYYAVCQVRDPLDLVVSQYFSHGWIHGSDPSIDEETRRGIQEGKISIFNYALLEFRGKSGFGEASILDKYCHLNQLKKLLEDKCMILKYEDMVLHYGKWSRQLSRFLKPITPITSTQNLLAKLTPDYNKFKQKREFFGFRRKERFWENPLDYVREEMLHAHIRSPLPGDHLRFLTPVEITSLRALEKEALGSLDL